MILGSELEYRNLKGAYNYSMLRTFDENRNKYYREYELNDSSKKEMNHSMKLGSLVHTQLLEPQTFDDKYNVLDCPPISGQWLLFTEELYNVTLKYVKNNVITVSMENRLRETYDKIKQTHPDKFKGKTFEWIVENFSLPIKKGGSSPKEYYTSCLSNFEKIPIDINTLSWSDKITDSVKFGKYTKDIFKVKEGIEMRYEVPIVKDFMGVKIKGLLDIIEINHNTKTVRIVDLKTVYDAENFNYTFRKNKYYLQASLYYELLDQFIADAGLIGYTMDNHFDFLVVDTTLQIIPHYWKCTEDVIKKGREGYVDEYGIYHKGFIQIIEEIEYCKNTNDFRDSIELSSTGGIQTINI